MNERRPNIIIFNPDQWRGKDVGCLGNPIVRTPHTDALAEEGVAFSQCFVQNTVCTPSRCSFMTGWYPHVRGHRTMHHMLSPEEPFLLQELKDAGYTVWWGGKNDVVRVEHQSEVCNVRVTPEDVDYDRVAPAPMEQDDPLYYTHYRGKVAEHEIVSNDDALVQAAIDFLQSRPQEPFCICLALHDPHVPFQVEEPYYSMYDRENLPPLIPLPPKGNKTRHLDEIRARMKLDGLCEADFKEILAVYYGMITKTDAALGRLTNALKQTENWDDTAVFVFSDHGEYAGDYRMVEKTQVTFEDDLTRVPLVIKYPASIPIPSRTAPVDALVELIDFYATVAELAKLPKRHTHFGKSLIPISTGITAEHREHVFCEGGALIEEPHTHEPKPAPSHVYWPRVSVQSDYIEQHGKAVMIRSKTWKLVRRLYERDELYNLAADPDELQNVIDDKEFTNIRLQLTERIADWYLATGDVVPYKLNPRSAKEIVPEYG
ncbi:sulfatase-like hydrolase/transferase [Paenibacillus sp. CF384]|uniref:sulfatase-like hydrolase/transferase n=1 Tax=Paenibacillus sp. CF384 TaxID=1884382 RepID=UPI001C435D0C|nr:sulfatase-like hydrolase/transferase [Paenibacillus sp. CF384]